ncbi:MAG: hypothetical protein JSV03_07905 [Planctomycetota bacterium]|nr:MAG: hypothetical protein JSV03_07905 [Planctomycetota bacterium]
MSETIESFINKLQADGVQAGREMAEKIRAEADQRAQQLIQEAQTRAKEIIDRVEAESERVRTKTKTELELAARDTIMRLREVLNRAIQGILTTVATEKLRDVQFIQELLHDIVMQYVRADIKGNGVFTINISEEMRSQLAHWAIQAMHKDLMNSGMVVDLHGSLSEAGFEYKISEGTVEITVESVVELLSELVGPEVHKIIGRTMTEADNSDSDI